MSTAVQNESDIVQVEGIYSKGFGLAPKLVMQDQRISAIGKAIYCYFCSYAGAGKIAFPKLSKVINDLKTGLSKSELPLVKWRIDDSTTT